MSESIVSTDVAEAAQRVTPGCHFCNRSHEPRASLRELPPELSELLKFNETTGEAAQICANCIELFSRARAQIDSHQTIFEQTDHVLPTPLRLNADERFTGRGGTMAFLVLGFFV